MAPGTPVGAAIQRVATYLRYPPASRDERLAALLAQVFGVPISAGALANLFQGVNARLDHRLEESLTRLRSRRVICRDETSARVNGRNQWEGVFQNAAVCIHVSRPSRGRGVIQEVLGAHRPTVWVSDLYRAQKQPPAEPWHVCLAHQLRDCPCALAAGDAVLAPRLQAVLLHAFALHKRRDQLTESTLEQYRCDLKRRLARCLTLEPTHKHGRRLQKRDRKMTDHLLVFLEDRRFRRPITLVRKPFA
jgi:transposase